MTLDEQSWPIPRPSWRARRYCATTLTDKTVPFGDSTVDLASAHADAPSVRRRVRRLESGTSLRLNLLIRGQLSWCPPFTAGHPLVLTATTATISGGGGPSTERQLPLKSLRLVHAVLLDPPERPVIPGLETWTLTVSQAEGTASITGLLADLAVLAAVAEWPPPPAVLDHHHAGATGAPPRDQPARPPIRLAGWLLIILGVLLMVGVITALASSDHVGPVVPLGTATGLLIVSGVGLRRRHVRRAAESGDGAPPSSQPPPRQPPD